MIKLKRILLGLWLVFMTQNITAQVVSKGNVMVDVNYGVPNLFNLVVKEAVKALNVEDLNAQGIGPVGARVDYMITERVGLGLDGAYSTLTVNYKKISSYDNQMYQYKATANRVRVIGRASYHFGGQSEHFDPYLTFGLGYMHTKVKVDSQDPYLGNNKLDVTIPLPVVIRASFGVRYFIVPNVGLNAEIGLGGVLLTGGISVKI